MKRIYTYLSALVAVAALAASCAKEENAPESTIPEGKGVRFTASQAKVLETRTTIENGTGTERIVKWAKDDEIKIFWDGGSVTAKAAEAGASTTFDAEVDPAEAYFAVYPSSAATFADNALTIEVPASQAGTFASANIAVATTTTTNFSFLNATSIVKFDITDATYTKAVFRGQNGEAIAGKSAVTFDSGNLVYAEPTETAKEVEITLSGAGSYYFAVLPCNLADGFSISLYKGTDTTPAAYIISEYALTRQTLLNLGGIEDKGVSDIFVKADGTGGGKSWDKAMGPAQLAKLLSKPANAAVLDGVTIHMAAGDYYLAGAAGLADTLAFPDYTKPVSISFKGGYPATLTGTDVSAARDTSVTAFTGNNEAKILFIGANTNVSFDGITFKNSVTTDSGNAALGINSSSATVTVTSCTFKDNSNSNNSSGAALTIQDGTLTVTRCTFTGNTARNAGALYLAGSKALPVRISYCKFEGNTSTNTSGAAQNAMWTDVQFSHCGFYNNEAEGWAGGAFHTSEGAKTTFEDCVFDGNMASKSGNNGRGGAVSIEKTGSATFTRCSFKNNIAKGGDNSLGGEGNTAIASNSAGGAIILHDSGSVILNDCTFTGNSAPNGCGGALASKSSSAPTTINSGTSFSDNTCYFHGGAIYAFGDLTVKGSVTDSVKFTSNSTKHTTRNYGNGGAVFVAKNTTASFEYVLFKGNEAGVEATDGYSSGGALRAKEAKKVTLSNCQFTANRGANGNGFSFQSCTQGTFTDCNFHDNIGMSGANKDGNTSRFYGGAGELSNGTTSFSKCTFKNNKARSASGAIHFNGTPTAYFSDCIFDGNSTLSQGTAGSNTAGSQGGGCFKCPDGTMLTFARCIFKNNSANNRGAVFQLGHNSVVFMNQVAFKDNNLTASSGNIWGVNIHSGKSFICMNNVSSYNNSAKSTGTHHAFNTDGGWIITNSTFVDKCATGVVRANNTSGNGSLPSVLCNSIFINTKTADNTLVISTAITSKGHNLFSRSSAPSNFTLDSSDVNSVTSLNAGAYSENGYRGYYSWTNNLSGFSVANATIAESAIKSCNKAVGSLSTNIGLDFYNWLVEIGEISNSKWHDGTGAERTGTWWPGAYQEN